MRVHEILEGTTVNGPGFRLCVWVQGCRRRCAGCFNKATWDMDGGYEMSVEQIAALFAKKNYDGLSVSGGEPFLQDGELCLLLQRARQAGLNTLVFTGFKYEELAYLKKSALIFCDYLVDGEYIKDIPSRCKYAGSGNQRFLSLEDGRIKEDLTGRTDSSDDIEIHISGSGEIKITGFDEI